MNCLYILEMNPLLVICKYFLQFCGLSFHLFIVSFAVQKLLNLIRTHFFSFVFIFIRRWIKNILLWFMSKSVLPMSSSESFIVSSLTLMFLIHFELIFVCGVKEYSNFILLHVAVQFSQHHLLKKLYFPCCTFLPPLFQIK